MSTFWGDTLYILIQINQQWNIMEIQHIGHKLGGTNSFTWKLNPGQVNKIAVT